MSHPNPHIATPIPFPQPAAIQTEQDSPAPNHASHSPTAPAHRSRTSTNASSSSAVNRIRSASIKLMEADPPPGMWAATGTVAAKAPTMEEIRTGSFNTSGWKEAEQRTAADRKLESLGKDEARMERDSFSQGAPSLGSAARLPLADARTALTGAHATVGVDDSCRRVIDEELRAPAEAMQYDSTNEGKDGAAEADSERSSEITQKTAEATPGRTGPERQYSNGYVPPPKVPWKTSTIIGLRAFWKWFLTPAGFLITLYGLNVVAWGGMLFLLLCNAAPAMCHPTCNDIQSPRRIWIEIDSQILNALFCVTGFGLAPWRFRDLYWWSWWRIGGSQRKETGIRRLAGIHRGWFRLRGSDGLSPTASPKTTNPEDPAVPVPHDKMPHPPPTGIHAPPTKSWKMDFVLWMNASNTFFQIVLCFYMYHYNRYDRPSWATGLFVALGCIVAGVAGIMMYHEGKLVKKVEGVPPPTESGKATDVEAQHALVEPAPSAKAS